MSKYKKIKDSWYLGDPATDQAGLRHGLFHLHTERGAVLGLAMHHVWHMNTLKEGTTFGNAVTSLDIDEIVYGCECGAVAPDDVVDVVLLSKIK